MCYLWVTFLTEPNLKMLRTLRKSVEIRNLELIIKRHAGHSKWANIKHTKALKDAQKSSLFTKIGRQMRVAIQEGGTSDPSKNLKLGQIIEQAKRLSVPTATIQSIIKATQTNKKQCKSYMLEIKGPGGAIIVVEVFTENLNGLKMTLAAILKKHSSKYSDGGGSHLFDQKGIVDAEVTKMDSDVLEVATEHAIESGAEDVKLLDDKLQFTCGATNVQKVQHKLEKFGYKITSASVEMIPLKLQLLSETDIEVYANLYEKLENHPDVVNIYDNIA